MISVTVILIHPRWLIVTDKTINIESKVGRVQQEHKPRCYVRQRCIFTENTTLWWMAQQFVAQALLVRLRDRCVVSATNQQCQSVCRLGSISSSHRFRVGKCHRCIRFQINNIVHGAVLYIEPTFCLELKREEKYVEHKSCVFVEQ